MRKIHSYFLILNDNNIFKTIKQPFVNFICSRIIAFYYYYFISIIVYCLFSGVLVNFVDYGNTALIKKDNVWTVSEEHCTIPVQATCCSLNNITTVNEDTPWAPATELEPFFNQDKYFVTFIANDDGEQNSKSWFVDLVNEDNKDIGELLVEAGFAAKKSVLQSEYLFLAQ